MNRLVCNGEAHGEVGSQLGMLSWFPLPGVAADWGCPFPGGSSPRVPKPPGWAGSWSRGKWHWKAAEELFAGHESLVGREDPQDGCSSPVSPAHTPHTPHTPPTHTHSPSNPSPCVPWCTFIGDLLRHTLSSGESTP